ncbi:hypothetical protein CCYA_CCYA02G0584 [Cyanidiococcus yangmingshanensis]|nr:hypothetical protein CCYA_CCYA02G0584 [Cyanidiococcus yangmingshanensis]
MRMLAFLGPVTVHSSQCSRVRYLRRLTGRVSRCAESGLFGERCKRPSWSKGPVVGRKVVRPSTGQQGAILRLRATWASTSTGHNTDAVEEQKRSRAGHPRVRIQRLYAEAAHYLEPANAYVHIKGWVRTVRDQKQFAFVQVNDGSNVSGVQVVVDGSLPSFHEVTQLTTGCSVAVLGYVRESPGKEQPIEIHATSVELIGSVSSEYPLQKKRHSFEFLRGIAHLRPRTNSFAAVARIRSALASATHTFFQSMGFIYLHSPIITSSDCEGAGEMFRVTTLPPGAGDDQADFFGQRVSLTVSGQLSAEAYACAMGDVYTFGPTFRAENSNTKRHLAEFWMIEPEMAFASRDDAMDNAEAYVKYGVSFLLDKQWEDLQFFDRFIEKGIVQKLEMTRDLPFARVTYTDAIEILSKSKEKFEFRPEWGADLQTEHERYLAEKHFQRPVFVYNYPAKIKAFYMRSNDSESNAEGRRTVAAFDLLVPGIGELIGGSQREERYEMLLSRMQELNLNPDQYWWYLDLRRYGTVPHAGYGLGFERFVQYCTGMDNIRDVIPFPRYPGHCDF